MADMSLLESVKILVGGRELTVEEATSLANFQKAHDVDDSDPMIMCYALMAKNQLISDSIADRMRQEGDRVIALQTDTLRERCLMIAQELLIELSRKMELELIRKVESAQADLKTRWIRFLVVLLVGILVGCVATAVIFKSF